MNFTYKIENYIPSEKRVFVVYHPTDNSLDPYGNWVGLDDNMTGSEIHERIVQCVPLVKWERVSDPTVEELVGYISESVTYTAPVIEEVTTSLENTVRGIRNDKLARSDWTQLADAPLTPEQKQLWEDHRQDLRDVPSQAGFPNNVVWPVAP